MRFSVATVSLPTLAPEQAVTEIAASGFAGVEWRVAPTGPEPDNPAHPFLRNNWCSISLTTTGGERAARLSRTAGLAIVGLAPYITLGDLAGVEAALRTAVAARTTQIRIQAPRIREGAPNYRELFARTEAFLEAAQELSMAYGVRLAVEIHHRTICPSASLTHRLVSRFDPKHVGVIYDFGNLVVEGYEDPRIGLSLLGEYVVHVHLKNAAARRCGVTGRWEHTWAPLDDGLLNVPWLLSILREFQYDGWISLEDLSLDRDPLNTLRYNARLLREWGVLPESREADTGAN